MKALSTILVFMVLAGCGRDAGNVGGPGHEVTTGEGVIYDRGGIPAQGGTKEVDESPNYQGTERTPNARNWSDESGLGAKGSTNGVPQSETPEPPADPNVPRSEKPELDENQGRQEEQK